MSLSKVQLGKNGITKNFLSTLSTHFKNNNLVKVSVLKSARGEGQEGRDKTKQYSEEILEELGIHFTARIIGHTIAFKKWRRAQR